MSVTIYHNPSCGTSRNTLAMIRQSGEEPEVIEYLKTPPSRARLVELIAALGISARALLREKGTPYAELGLADPKWSDGELIDFMLAHPILINRPIVVTPKGVRLCRPSELVLDLLDRPVETFVKEDGEAVGGGNRKGISGFRPSRLRGIMAYGTHAPPAPDELAGQPEPDRPARKRSAPRFLRALPCPWPGAVARAGLHRHAAPGVRGAWVSLERFPDQ
jgi:arsenate reductase